MSTSAPTRGHLAVSLNIEEEDTKEVKVEKSLKNANWKELCKCVESVLTKGLDFKTMNAEALWLLLKELFQTA